MPPFDLKDRAAIAGAEVIQWANAYGDSLIYHR